MTISQTADPQELLEQLPFARALARSLVSDHARAEDVVQESYVKALERPPRMGPNAGSLRGWIARVVRNTAAEQARAGGRRDWRERASAKPEAIPSAAELSELAESQRLLMEVLLELDERRRHVVMLRYHEGLSSVEIARRLGCPAGTIRWQLKAGLSELRERLDHRTGGDRTTWQRALIPLASSSGRSVGAAAGLVAFLSASKLAVVATIAVVAALAVWWGGKTPTPASDLVSLAQPRLEERADSALPLGGGEAHTAASREGLGETRATVVHEPEETEATLQPSTSIRMRFVDRSGTGVPGVRVADRAWQLEAKSDAGGLAELRYPAGRRLVFTELNWSCPGFAVDGMRVIDEGTLRGQPGPPKLPEEVDLGELRLVPGGAIEGTVVDHSGTPREGLRVFVPGVSVEARAGLGLLTSTETSLGAVEALSDEAGRFRLEGVVCGSVRVHAESDDKVLTGVSPSIEVAQDAPVEALVLRVKEIPSNRRIEGRVVDSSGSPLAGVFLKAEWKTLLYGGRSLAWTDEQGNFRFVLEKRTSRVKIVVDPTDDHAGRVFEGIRSGDSDLNLVLELPRRFSVAPVVSASERMDRRAWLKVLRNDELFTTLTDLELDGSIAQVPLPDTSFRLQCGGRGLLTRELGPFDPEQLGAAPMRIELSAARGWRGVVRASGEGIVGAEVSLARPARSSIEMAGVDLWMDPSILDATRSDDRGEFELFPDEDGDFFVLASAPGFATSVLGPMRFERGAVAPELELVLSTGGRLVGRAHRLEGLRTVQRLLLSRGDGRPRVVTTDAEGRFSAEHLTPGPYKLRRLERSESVGGWTSAGASIPAAELSEPDLWIHEGETTEYELRQPASEPACRIEVSFRPDPEFGEEFALRLMPKDPGANFLENREVAWRPGEVAVLELAEPGPAYLLARGGSNEDPLMVTRFVEALPGDQSVELVLRSAQVRFDEESLGDDPTVLGGWDPSQEAWFLRMVNPEVTSVPFPAGEVFTLAPESMGLPPELWTRLEEARLAPGGTARLERP